VFVITQFDIQILSNYVII